ncbi:MAG: peptidylprolyl isomerase [Vulcanimicrobiaceae bacterium]
MRALVTFCAGITVLALSAFVLGATPPESPYAQILRLERARSLGGGRLAAFLASPEERVAVRAALAIGRTKQPGGVALLDEHLRDPRVGVRAMSVYGLGLIASGADVHALLAALSDPSGAVRVAAADALGRYEAAKRLADEPAASQALLQVLAHDANPIVRSRAAIALELFRSESTAPTIASGLEAAVHAQRAPAVRRNAMWSLFRGYANRLPIAFLRTALHDRDEVVRIEAVRALGKRKRADERALLLPLLHDPSWRVQEQAGESLRAIDGKAFTADWKAIPATIHLPAIAADPLAGLPALPRDVEPGKPVAPRIADVSFAPVIDPKTAAQMTGPAPGLHPRVRIVTNKGNVYVTLFPEWAPLTVANFLDVAAHGYYDNNRWFRIVPDFVVQTGDPNDNGNGDAGYTIGAEENPLEQRTGVISMGMNYDSKTNTPIRDSAGTQYYVTLSPQYHLDRDFTVFGQVTSGFDVLAHLVESDRVVRVERIADVRL